MSGEMFISKIELQETPPPNFFSWGFMMSCDCVLFHNRHNLKSILMTMISRRKTLKRFKRIYRSLILGNFKQICYHTILMFIIYFIRKRCWSIRLTRHTLNSPLTLVILFRMIISFHLELHPQSSHVMKKMKRQKKQTKN